MYLYLVHHHLDLKVLVYIYGSRFLEGRNYIFFIYNVGYSAFKDIKNSKTKILIIA